MGINREHAFADGLAYGRPSKRPFFKKPWTAEHRAAEAWARFDKSAQTGEGCLLGPNAWCVNSLRSPERIVLRDRVVCRGLLRVEKFGEGRIHLGKRVYVGDDCLLSSAAGIEIEEDVLLAHGVQIFDNDSHPVDPCARVADYAAVHADGSRSQIAAKSVRIGARAWIGFGAIILKGVTIGQNSVVAAGSVVTRDVPPNSVVAGNPAVIVKSITP